VAGDSHIRGAPATIADPAPMRRSVLVPMRAVKARQGTRDLTPVKVRAGLPV
jgi:hypothetical protein